MSAKLDLNLVVIFWHNKILKWNTLFIISIWWLHNENYLYFTCSATLLAFLVELLKSSVAMQEQMLGGKGFLVIGYLLEKVSDMCWWFYCVMFIAELTTPNYIFSMLSLFMYYSLLLAHSQIFTFIFCSET